MVTRGVASKKRLASPKDVLLYETSFCSIAMPQTSLKSYYSVANRVGKEEVGGDLGTE